jgi:hypothetical protein
MLLILQFFVMRLEMLIEVQTSASIMWHIWLWQGLSYLEALKCLTYLGYHLYHASN